jgi:hypothetical protein
MSDNDRDSLELADEDRLPWLEAVEDTDDDDGISPAKLVGGVIGALVALGVVIAGVWWIKDRNSQAEGDGTLIAAAEGDYKVKPDEPGGMKVDGQGDSSFATSEGAEASGQIDTSAMPEAPVAGARAPEKAPERPVAGGPAATVKVADGGKMPAPAPKPAVAAAPTGPAGSVVQLGAFGSEAIANAQWTTMSKRFGFLAPLGKVVIPAKVGGTTYYRLRVNAGSASAANSLCGKLKVAGENCIIAPS